MTHARQDSGALTLPIPNTRESCLNIFLLKCTLNCFSAFVQTRLKQHLIKMCLFYPGENLLKGAPIEHKSVRVRVSSQCTFGDQKNSLKTFQIVQQKVFHFLFRLIPISILLTLDKLLHKLFCLYIAKRCCSHLFCF